MAEDRVLATNRHAYHNFHILETCECGIALTGGEVKSIRSGGLNLKEGYVVIRNGEAWLVNTHISPYKYSRLSEADPKRDRKLLLHKDQIRRLAGRVQEKGLTLVPTKCYLKNGRIKIELGLAKGKKLYDKRETAMRKTIERETEAELKKRFR
ncbi:MAG: SsrA-binding protein SmpB [Acidobacteria bacterium]|nr:SsrA-binding protein SmpB [Acidobacteriota bacterium]